jgi:chromosome partitioning protein
VAFFSMVDGRKRLHREVMERLTVEHETVLEAFIPAAADVERMGLRRTVIAEFAPRSRAAQAYEALWAEVRKRLA